MSPAQALKESYQRALQRRAFADDPAQRAVLARLGQLADCLHCVPRRGNFRRWLLGRWSGSGSPPCRGVYLWGGVGRGKTWLMDLFCEQLPAGQVQRLHYQHLMREVHRQLAGSGRERPLRAVAAAFARRAPVLCIDEFAVQDIGDAMLMDGLLDGLLRQGVVLVCTSNTAPPRLYENGLQRARFLPTIALLQDRLDVIEIGAGLDYRLRQLQGSATWLRSQDPASTQRMQQLFRALSADSATTGARTLEVEGRTLPVRAATHGMAWFDFVVLCAGPRSAGDYIFLADELHTLLLSDVPVFTETDDDAARRFISLVDELYDRRVKLVASAAAEPDQLYRGQRLRDAFARTTSRLVEMRSHEYLARAHQAGAALRDRV
ncbi:MAG: cell division protein ZapE [Pseudomonadota bacterium]